MFRSFQVLAGIVIAAALATVIGVEARQATATDAKPHAVASLAAARPARPLTKPAPVRSASAPAPAPSVTPTPEAAAYVVKRVLPIAGPMHQGDWYWDEDGAPQQGRIVITADLAAGTLSVFRAGYEIGTAVIIFGADETPTPTGVFPILMKDADHHSATYDNAPMPFTLRLTRDGVAIHGSEVGDDYVTHGCIGLPVAFAKKLFGVAHVGDTAIVTRGEMLNQGEAIRAAAPKA